MYQKNKKHVYIYIYYWKSRLPTKHKSLAHLDFGCAVLICVSKTAKSPSLEIKIKGLAISCHFNVKGTTNTSCGWSVIRDHRAKLKPTFLSSLNRGVLVETSIFFPENRSYSKAMFRLDTHLSGFQRVSCSRRLLMFTSTSRDDPN